MLTVFLYPIITLLHSKALPNTYAYMVIVFLQSLLLFSAIHSNTQGHRYNKPSSGSLLRTCPIKLPPPPSQYTLILYFKKTVKLHLIGGGVSRRRWQQLKNTDSAISQRSRGIDAAQWSISDVDVTHACTHTDTHTSYSSAAAAKPFTIHNPNVRSLNCRQLWSRYP